MADLTVKTNTPITMTTTSNPVVTTGTIVAKPPVAPVATNLVPMANTATTNNMGLKVESEKQKTEPLKQEPPKNNNAYNKKGPGLDETLGKFYGDKYKKASPEEKEKLIVKYFDWLSTDKKNVISQLDQFKLYRSRCKNDDEYYRLSSVIDKMESKYQLNAATTVVTQGNDRQRYIGQKAVANDYHHYDKTVQVGVSKLIVDSGNQEAIQIGASHASETDKTNQVAVVKNFQSIDNIDVNKTLIDQYGKYSKENEIGIHTIMSGSKHSETVEYAASNIWHFDKENQAPAVKITTNTGNEKAINAAAAQYGKYDQSARAQIKETIYNSGYDSAKNTLSSAEKAEIEQQSETDSEETKKSSSNEIKDIMNSGALNKDELIKESFKNATQAQKEAWLDSLSPNELSNIINILPIDMLSSSKFLKLMNSADAKAQKELVAKINSTSLTNVMETRMGFLGSAIQSIYVQDAAKKGKLGSISKDKLSFGLIEDYKKLLNEQNKG